jgi:outer membrane protein assembly factor BamB
MWSSIPDTHFKESSDKGIVAIDLATRSVKWSLEGGSGVYDTPAIADGTLFVGSNFDYLYAIDAQSGALKWKFKAGAQAPVVRDGIVYFGDSDNVYAVDAKNGILKWKQKNSGGIATMIAVSKSAIFYGGDHNFRCLDRETGDIKWTVKIKGQAYEPVVVGNKVYAGGTEELLMLDAETGARFPTVSLGPDDVSTPVFFGNTVIVDNGDGYLFAFKK